MFVLKNGAVQKAGEARLSVFEHGFMYGLGQFETFRVYDGHPFLLDEHMLRLERGLLEMNIQWTYDRNLVQAQIKKVLSANHWKNAYVRFNVSAGPGPLGLDQGQYEHPEVIIYAKPLEESNGVHLLPKKGKILETKRNTPESEVRLKSHHYFNSILGKNEIRGLSDTEGLFLTKEGYVAEGIVSNIFWKRGTTLYTPAVKTGILPGITRKAVILLAEKRDYYIREGCFSKEMLIEAEEAFVTNSIQEISPLLEIDKQTYAFHSGVSFELASDYAEARRSAWSFKDLL